MKCRAFCSNLRVQLSCTKRDLGETGCVQQTSDPTAAVFRPCSCAGKECLRSALIYTSQGLKVQWNRPSTASATSLFSCQWWQEGTKVQKQPVSSFSLSCGSPFKGQVTPASGHVTPPCSQNQNIACWHESPQARSSSWSSQCHKQPFAAQQEEGCTREDSEVAELSVKKLPVN